MSDIDPLLSTALTIIVETRKATVINLQRELRLGYARAAKIMEQLEYGSFIGPYRGKQSRDIWFEVKP